MRRGVTLTVTAATTLAVLVGLSPLPAAGQATGDGPLVGQWKTWVLTSGSEIPVPTPPADDSAQTKAELDELRQLQSQRSDVTNTAIQFFNGVPATQRWTELTDALITGGGPRGARAHAIVSTAMFDAVVAAWHAKYTYNRKPPGVLAPDISSAIPGSTEPSYPSEHAAIAGAAAAMLSYLSPNDAQTLAAWAQEAAQSRLLAGANYRSDVEAGLALGQAVAQKAIARAAADGSDAKWTGTVPTGPGLWIGTDPQEPLAGTWKPWLLTSYSQFRPGPPPAFGSAQFLADLAEVKRIVSNPTPSQRAIGMGQGGFPTPDLPYTLITRDKLSTPRAARVLAVYKVAIADAVNAAWDGKYTYWRIRPYQADPSIKPLVAPPNFPSYPAGGPSVYTAAAEALAYFFPQDAARLRYLGEERSLGRMYSGLHYRSDIEAAQQLARRVVALAIQHDQLTGN
jgi:PAP2 superfamily